MSMIINITTKIYETQSHRVYPDNWNGDGWIAVPPELERDILENAPFCDLELSDGVLVKVVPTTRPPEEVPEPTEAERMRADIDFLAVMMEVEL